MRVALNLEQLVQRPPGGIARYAAELARLLPRVAEPGEGVTVLPFVARHRAREVRAAFAAFGLDDEPVVLGYPRPLLYELWNRWGRIDPTRRTLALRDVDVVHAPSVAVPPRGRTPLVVTVHDAAPIRFPETYPRRGRRFHALGFAAAASRADAIIAPSSAAADEIAEYTAIARASMQVIHHGVDSSVVSDDVAAATVAGHGLDGAPYVVWVGTLEPRKDVGLLVDAFATAVVDRGLPHRLVLVGPGGWLDAQSEVARRAERLGDRVRFLGSVSGDDVRALFRGAALFALPSRHEGFGLPVLEAMAQGTAVVCSDLPVLREVAGDAARFASAGDRDGWAHELSELLGDDAARAAFGAAGQARARMFSWERSAAAHLAVYRQVV